jgi:Uncharacterized protein involved in chromosome partitioning
LSTIDSKQDELRTKLGSLEDELMASKQRIVDAEKEEAELAEAEKALSKKYSGLTVGIVAKYCFSMQLCILWLDIMILT